MKNIRIEGRLWRDKVNGNTYHSSRVYVDGKLTAVAPFQYGYGNQYEWSGWAVLVKLLDLDVKRYEHTGGCESPFSWAERHDVEYSADYANVLKREVIAWGLPTLNVIYQS